MVLVYDFLISLVQAHRQYLQLVEIYRIGGLVAVFFGLFFDYSLWMLCCWFNVILSPNIGMSSPGASLDADFLLWSIRIHH